MLLSSLLLSFVAMHIAQVHFSRERVRFLRTISEQFDHITLLILELERQQRRTKEWLPPGVVWDGALWPTDAAIVFRNGRVRSLFGRVPSALHLRIFTPTTNNSISHTTAQITPPQSSKQLQASSALHQTRPSKAQILHELNSPPTQKPHKPQASNWRTRFGTNTPKNDDYASIWFEDESRPFSSVAHASARNTPYPSRLLLDSSQPRWERRKIGQRILWERYRPLLGEGNQNAVLWLRWDVGAMQKEFYSYQGLLFLYLMLFCLLILIVVMLFLESRLVRPIHRLGDAIMGITDTRIGTDLRQEMGRSDQIGDLARALLKMKGILQQQTTEREKHIEELHTANQALERAQDELVQREKLATIGFLAAGVAHEVGNPLSAIMGYSDLLLESREWEEFEGDLLKRILRETKRIDRIIRDLITYARPVVADKPGDPIIAVHETLELLKLQKRFRTMEVETTWQSPLPQINLSENYLIQILINLLLNASDACKGHGKVVIAIVSLGKSVVIRIADNGPGIAPEAHKNLFEPFFSTKAPGEGVGLGLALCKRLVSEVGGNIIASKSPMGGAMFSLELPIAEEKAVSVSSDYIEVHTPPNIQFVTKSNDEWKFVFNQESSEEELEQTDLDDKHPKDDEPNSR